jgi:hypothetical protein
MKIGVYIEVAETPDDLGMYRVIFLETGKWTSRWPTFEQARKIGESEARDLNGDSHPWECLWNSWSIEKRKRFAREGL